MEPISCQGFVYYVLVIQIMLSEQLTQNGPINGHFSAYLLVTQWAVEYISVISQIQTYNNLVQSTLIIGISA